MIMLARILSRIDYLPICIHLKHYSKEHHLYISHNSLYEQRRVLHEDKGRYVRLLKKKDYDDKGHSTLPAFLMGKIWYDDDDGHDANSDITQKYEKKLCQSSSSIIYNRNTISSFGTTIVNQVIIYLSSKGSSLLNYLNIRLHHHKPYFFVSLQLLIFHQPSESKLNYFLLSFYFCLII